MFARRVSVVAVALLSTAPTAIAQQSPAPTTADGAGKVVSQLTALQMDTLVDAVPIRSEDAIQRDIERVNGDKQIADSNRKSLEDLRDRAKQLVSVQDADIKSIDQRLKVAKQDNREADRVTLESDKKVAQRTRDLLLARRELRDAEVETAMKRREAAEAAETAFALELQLARQRKDSEQVPVTRDIAGARRRSSLIDLQRRTLEAQRDYAAKTRDWAEQATAVVERRLKAFDMQQRLENGQ